MAKASLHVQAMKTFSIEQAAENERCWTHEQYKRKNTDGEKNNHYDWTRREINFKVMLDSEGRTEIRSLRPQDGLKPTLHAKLQERLDFLGHKAYKAGARNNPFTCVDIVIGGDQSRMREMAFGDQKVAFDLSEDNSGIKRMREIEEWATDTYEFAREQWGDENIIGMEVHLDESTPHAHVLIVPTAMRKQRGRKSKDKDKPKEETLKVSFSGCWGDNELERSEYTSKLHTVFYEKVGTKYGLERGDVIASLPEEERLERVHKNKRQLEAERQSKENERRAKKEALEAENKKLNAENQFSKVQKQIESEMKIQENVSAKLEEKRSELKDISSNLKDVSSKLEEKQSELEKINSDIQVNVECNATLEALIDENEVILTGQHTGIKESCKGVFRDIREKFKKDGRTSSQIALERKIEADNRIVEANKAIQQAKRRIKEADGKRNQAIKDRDAAQTIAANVTLWSVVESVRLTKVDEMGQYISTLKQQVCKLKQDLKKEKNHRYWIEENIQQRIHEGIEPYQHKLEVHKECSNYGISWDDAEKISEWKEVSVPYVLDPDSGDCIQHESRPIHVKWDKGLVAEFFGKYLKIKDFVRNALSNVWYRCNGVSKEEGESLKL